MKSTSVINALSEKNQMLWIIPGPLHKTNLVPLPWDTTAHSQEPMGCLVDSLLPVALGASILDLTKSKMVVPKHGKVCSTILDLKKCCEIQDVGTQDGDTQV